MKKPKKKPPSQRQRFIEAAREAGASEDEAVFRENLKRIAKAKPADAAHDAPKPANKG